MKLRSLTLVASLAALAASAHAAELHLAGNTVGSSFDFSAPGSSNPGGLSYQSGVFNTTTVAGEYSLGSTNLFTNSLGTFTLVDILPGGTDTYKGSFNLLVNFTLPTGILPGSTATYTAKVKGTLSTGTTPGTSGSSLRIDFDNNPQSFTFSGPAGQSGSFDLIIEDVNIGFPTSGSTVVAVTGYGTANVTSVPAPGAMAAFGLGLVGAIRRKRKA